MVIGDKYQRNLVLLDKYISPAMNRLFDDYGEIFLSLDRDEVVRGVVARIRLNLENEDLRNIPLVLVACEKAFIALLDENRITVKSFGFSILAQEEIRELRAKFSVAQ